MELQVLVVCPDQDSASLRMSALSEMGIAAELTASISTSLQLLEEKRFDGIIFDYRDDETSREFLWRLRQSSKNRNPVLIAVVDKDFNARPVFGLGANFVLYRPLSVERLRLSLQAARGLMRRERRLSPRVPVGSTVEVSCPGAADMSATLHDLSDGGTKITTDRRLPEVGKVYFEFALPGQSQLVRLSGEVAWQDSSGRTGIRFVDVPQASRRLIRSWLQQQRDMAREGTKNPPAGLAKQPGLNPQPRESADAIRNSDSSNRRKELRLPCAIGADIYEVGTSVPNRCTLSDISEGGCYVEMPTPLAGQSRVEILVRTGDIKFKIKGEVLATHPGFGMGVRFLFRDQAERAEVLRLLGVLAVGPSLDEQPR